MSMSTDPRFTASDPRFDPDYVPPEVPTKKKLTGLQTCLVGCLVMVAIAILVVTVFGIWVGRNWRGWASSATGEVMKHGIDASDLPPAEKADIKAQVDRLSLEFRDGRLTAQQVGRIFEKLAKSPLMAIIVMPAIEKQYFDKSGLSAEEKAEGKQSLRRFWRGLIDEKIEPESVDLVMAHLADREPDGEWRLRQRVTDDDLRGALAEAKSLADAAGVPEEPEDFDPSEEFQKAIDEAMNEPQYDTPVEARNNNVPDFKTPKFSLSAGVGWRSAKPPAHPPHTAFCRVQLASIRPYLAGHEFRTKRRK